MKRPRYKALYKIASGELGAAIGRAEDAESELGRLRALLADHGFALMRHVSEGTGKVELEALPYECVVSAILLSSRFLSGAPSTHGFTQYTWKGRPLVRV